VSSWSAGLGTAKAEDFTVVAVTQDSPSMLFVPMDSPFKTYQEMLDFAKANPGKLKVATSGYGTQDDITLKYFAQQGLQDDQRALRQAGGALRLADRQAHRRDLRGTRRRRAPFVQAGQLRPLVVFDDVRHAAFKDTPSSKELGFRSATCPTSAPWRSARRRRRSASKVLADAVNAALDTPEWKKFCADTYTCARGATPRPRRRPTSRPSARPRQGLPEKTFK
jgi:tripartite-type tricarboxylate transporter receptor subunit TctC